jgi:hypothetical protein
VNVTISLTRAVKGAVAGLAGGIAFAAVMKADIALSGRRVDDFQLLAGFGPTRDHWPVAGAVVHATNSIALGGLYSLVSDQLPGTGWQRGLTFAMVENTLLWPVLLVLDRVHPAIQSGELPAYNRPWPFLVENLRHAAYGLVLGVLFERLTRNDSAVAD